MNAHNLVKALLDGIDLPGYDDDSEPDEFTSKQTTTVLRFDHKVNHLYRFDSGGRALNAKQVRDRIMSAISPWLSSYNVTVVSMDIGEPVEIMDPVRVDKYPVVLTLKGEIDDIAGIQSLRHYL